MTHLELCGMTAYEEDLLSFLKMHALKTLCIGDFYLLGGTRWYSILSDMRSCLPKIEDFIVHGRLYDRDGPKDPRTSVNGGGYLPLEIEKYVKFGGQNPLESEDRRT